MLNPRLAGRYAKSILDLAIEKNSLDAVYDDMQFLLSVCSMSRDFVTLLKSPVVNPDKKQAVFDAIAKGRLSYMTEAFIKLLIRKGRESFLPGILSSFVQQYKEYNKIHVVKLITASPVSEEVKNSIIKKVQAETGFEKIELNVEVDEAIIGGFILQVGDSLVDASISYRLNNIRRQFSNNDYVYNIR